MAVAEDSTRARAANQNTSLTETIHVTHDNVLAAIADLGCESEEIAESLKKLGIKGVRESKDACPLAVYLKQKFSTDNVKVYDYDAEVNGVDVHLRVPAALFVDDFDDEDYPDLEQGGNQ